MHALAQSYIEVGMKIPQPEFITRHIPYAPAGAPSAPERRSTAEAVREALHRYRRENLLLHERCASI